MAISRSSAYVIIFFVLAMAGAGLASFVGVNYGRVANNLPHPTKVVQLLKSHSISQVKLYDADPAVLSALAHSGIDVVVALPNELLSEAATRPSFALSWVKENVAAWLPATQISAIAVGNEVFASPVAKSLTPSLVPAMKNLHSALQSLNLDSQVKISSPIALTALQSSYPPSSGVFRPDLADQVMKPMLDLIKSTGSYLMVNAYPFFAYEANADIISLDYALFRPNSGVVDPVNGLRYENLLDAQLDAVFAAMTALGFNDVKVIVSETGWPSKGDANEVGAGVDNAAAYNGNLARRVLTGNAGTPLRPAAISGVYLFGLFNEDQKPGPSSERNYGLFYPDEGRVYEVEFRLQGMGTRRDQSGSVVAAGGSGSGSGEWCVADARAGKEMLQAGLDYACGEGGADCREIQPGKGCFSPDSLVAHASYAFNSYFQRMDRRAGSCYFGGAAMVVNREPRFGDCVLPAGR